MKLSHGKVVAIVVLITVALSGLVILQSYLLLKSMEQKSEAFGRNVRSALASVVQSLESLELRDQIRISSTITSDTAFSFVGPASSVEGGDSVAFEAVWELPWKGEWSQPVHFRGDTLYYSFATPQHIMVEARSPGRQDALVLVDTFTTSGEHFIDVSEHDAKGKMFIMHVASDSLTYYMKINEDDDYTLQMTSANGKRDKMVRQIVNQLAVGEIESIEDRIDMSVLDSLLDSKLAESDLRLNYQYGVIEGDSILLSSSKASNTDLLGSEFQAQLFPHDFFVNRNFLSVFFPQREVFILGQMIPLLGSSLLFISVIVICFVIAIRSVIGQKRFATHLMDFINNMTHEFKTPIATVALASEAIARDDVKRDVEKIDSFNNMIRDENQRMRTQVDKILQMASIEEGEVELKVSRLDLHSVITDATRSIALSVESRMGHLVSDLSAENSIINGDSVHVLGIVKNLLDNANKYSPHAPEIVVRTSNSGEQICMTVSDNGI